MDRVHVEIYVPLLETCYEMFIPADSKIYYVVKTIVKYLDGLTKEFRFSDMDCCLFNKGNGVVYDPNMAVFESGIKNGTKLILM